VDLLLLSTSSVYGSGFLAYARRQVVEFLGNCRTLHFAPFAMADLDAYTGRVRQALAPLGVSVVGLHEGNDPREAIGQAEVLFVGGGNTFRLLRAFQQLDLLEIVRQRARSGQLRYMAASAGSNLACPTIRTTNDMPIVEPAGLSALGLLPFQINPHYLDPQPGSTHMGETREQRLQEYLEENTLPVLALREGAILHRRDQTLSLLGSADARLFRRNSPPVEYQPGADLSELLLNAS
jgi:dipeptidase E